MGEDMMVRHHCKVLLGTVASAIGFYIGFDIVSKPLSAYEAFVLSFLMMITLRLYER